MRKGNMVGREYPPGRLEGADTAEKAYNKGETETTCIDSGRRKLSQQADKIITATYVPIFFSIDKNKKGETGEGIPICISTRIENICLIEFICKPREKL